MSQKAIPLPEKALQAIKKYAENRFITYGVCAWKLTLTETPKFSYDYFIHQELTPEALGIFRHALTQCEFGLEVWTIVKKEDEFSQRWLVTGHLHYEHIGGGTNGCAIPFKFFVADNGDIAEQY